MASIRQSPIPEIYVLWHPDCPFGETLARKIYSWLRPGSGLGPDVFFRSATAPEGPVRGLPLALPGESRGCGTASSSRPRVSNVQIILPLIDANMVANQAWRHWLSMLASPSSSPHRRKVIPIALDATAYNVPSPIRDLNFLRPAGIANLAGSNAPAAALENAARSLLKQLTEALCRYMLSGRQAAENEELVEEGVLPKLKIFLSHAKADGTTPARRLRDYIYSQTQLAAFYDDNDIAYGAAFANVLKNDLTSRDTAALIAVRTARYAHRPWCRREVSLFRRPRRDPFPGVAQDRWLLNPTLVVDFLEPAGQTTSIAELGNSSCVRWDDAVPDQEEQVVTMLLRDVMLGAFHAAVGATIPTKERQVIINWLPDPTTLLSIDSVRSAEEIDIIHPGRGLSGLELDTLADFFPRLTFHSFEELLT